MLIFKKLELSDVNIIKPYLLLSKNRACDNTIGGTFIWRDLFCMKYAPYKQNFIFKACFPDKTEVFAMPLGRNNEEAADSLKQLELYCRENKSKMTIYLATGEDIELIKTLYRNIKITAETDWSDYLYKASDLANLEGRKYSGQRNHINYFKRTYANYSIKPINAETIGEVNVFFKKYNDKHNQIKNSSALIEEEKKVFEMLDNIENFNLYGQTGIILYIGDLIIGFAIGEIVSDTLFVHIEKADLDYRGAYQMLVNELAKRHINEGIEYINREDDAGDEHLRISKISYHPCDIIKKYTVEIEI